MPSNNPSMGSIIVPSVKPVRAHSDTQTDAWMWQKFHIQQCQIFIFKVQI